MMYDVFSTQSRQSLNICPGINFKRTYVSVLIRSLLSRTSTNSNLHCLIIIKSSNSQPPTCCYSAPNIRSLAMTVQPQTAHKRYCSAFDWEFLNLPTSCLCRCSSTWVVSYCTIIKWKRLFVNGCECKTRLLPRWNT